MEEELSRLEQYGIIERVEFAARAAPIVPVLKGNEQNVRICSDIKLTVNKVGYISVFPNLLLVCQFSWWSKFHGRSE